LTKIEQGLRRNGSGTSSSRLSTIHFYFNEVDCEHIFKLML